MNGFVIFDARSGTSVFSMVLRPGLGLAAVSAALDDSSAAATVAAMSFGVLLNAAAISGCPLLAIDSTDQLLERCREFSKTFSLEGDVSTNAATLKCVDAGKVSLSFFVHQVYPIVCVCSSSRGCPLGTALCERLCKAFCAACGCDYISRTQSSSPVVPAKQFRKLMAPLVKSIYASSIRIFFSSLTGSSSTALFTLLSNDRRKLIRSVTLRTGDASEGSFSDTEGAANVEVHCNKLSRDEIQLLKPFTKAKPYGSCWVTRNERGQFQVVARSLHSLALVCLVRADDHISTTTLQHLHELASSISCQLPHVEEQLMFLRTNNILVV